MPISTVISGLINFLVQFALFFILLLVYLAKGEVSPHWGMLLCVPLVLQVGLLGLGCGIIVSSSTTRLPRSDGRCDLRRPAVDVRLARRLPAVDDHPPVLRAVMVINP